MKNVRELRNACAHNSCIINDLKCDTEYKTYAGLRIDISKTNLSRKSINKRMKCKRIQQIVTLLYINNRIISSKDILNNHVIILNNLYSRINLHINYYKDNYIILKTFEFLKIIIDNWYYKSL